MNSNGANVLTEEYDIILNNELKCYLVHIESFNMKTLLANTEKENEVKEKEVEDEEPLWLCASCQMENDKDNISCVFCDAPKNVVPRPKKAKPKQDTKTPSITGNTLSNNEMFSILISKLSKVDNSITQITKYTALELSEMYVQIRVSLYSKEYIHEMKQHIIKELSKYKTIIDYDDKGVYLGSV